MKVTRITNMVQLVLIMVSLSYSSQECRTYYHAAGQNQCLVCFDECGPEIQFIQCIEDNSEQYLNEEKCLRKCCGSAGSQFSKQSYQACNLIPKEEEVDIDILIVAVASTVPACLIIVIICCVCIKSNRKRKAKTINVIQKYQIKQEQISQYNNHINSSMNSMEKSKVQRRDSNNDFKNQLTQHKDDLRNSFHSLQGSNICTICLGNEADCEIQSCKHYFHVKCLKQALDSQEYLKDRCPACCSNSVNVEIASQQNQDISSPRKKEHADKDYINIKTKKQRQEKNSEEVQKLYLQILCQYCSNIAKKMQLVQFSQTSRNIFLKCSECSK